MTFQWFDGALANPATPIISITGPFSGILSSPPPQEHACSAVRTLSQRPSSLTKASLTSLKNEYDRRMVRGRRAGAH